MERKFKHWRKLKKPPSSWERCGPSSMERFLGNTPCTTKFMIWHVVCWSWTPVEILMRQHAMRTLGGFIFVNLFPSLQYSIFPLPPGPFDSFLTLGKQWTKREKHVFLQKKIASVKNLGRPFFRKSPEKSCKHFCYIALASNSSNLNLYQHMFQNLHIYNLSTFSNSEIFGCIHQPTSGNCSNCFTHPTFSPMLHANRFLGKHRVSDLGRCGKNLI